MIAPLPHEALQLAQRYLHMTGREKIPDDSDHEPRWRGDLILIIVVIIVSVPTAIVAAFLAFF